MAPRPLDQGVRRRPLTRIRLGQAGFSARFRMRTIVSGGSEGEHPSYSVRSPEVSLAHPRHRFHPAEDFFHAFAPPLAHAVARMALLRLVVFCATCGVTFNSLSPATKSFVS